MNMQLSDGEQACAAGGAVLVIDSGGQRYAVDMTCVAEIRAMEGVQDAGPGQGHGILHRNGVRVPVFGLNECACPGSGTTSGAVVVLDLPDRIAAIAADAVCEVRITRSRPYLSPAKSSDGLRDSIACVAVWEGGEAPVLDAGAWLRAREARSADPCAP